ncbi:MAG: DUF3500 domain-containing protein [Chitinophagaceae bacterium]|nr:DUF3500 domain-containing protein [Chitinophagaceae bacterium]
MKPAFILLISCLIQNTCWCQSNSLEPAVKNFLKSLDEPQLKKAVYIFASDERYNWHYVPKSDRKGIGLHELDDEQRKTAFLLLKSSLSAAGYAKTIDIIQLENVLKVLENRDDDYRSPVKYYITIFGKPDEKDIWGWRFEGHHISFNFSTQNNAIISGTPGFLGANPAIVPSGPQKDKQVLREETELGFALLHSLNPQQLQNAGITATAPNDIITLASRKASIENKEGISYAAMTKEQQGIFMKLVQIYIHRYTKLFADNMMSELKTAGLDQLRFIWAGAQQAEGKPYYYRIQGPTIIIEYDNSQGNANHIHTVIRDLKHDFGGDELLEHYKKNH